MNETQSLTVADVEDILLKIHRHEQKISAAAQKRDASIDFYRQRIDDAKKIFDDETEWARNDIAELSATLEQYFREHPPTGKRKSLKFAGGSFGFSKAATKYFLDGEELNSDNKNLLAFVKNNRQEFVKVKENVDWAGLKAALDFDGDTVFFKDTGEVFDGVRAQKNFYVKVTP